MSDLKWMRPKLSGGGGMDRIKDILILNELEFMNVQRKLMELLDPFSDEQRIRIMRACEAYFAPIDPAVLDKLILKRAKIAEKQREKEDRGIGDV